MTRTAVLAAAVLAAAAAVTGVTAAAGAPAERAPECVTVVVLAPQADGTVNRVHLEFCGGGPGADSALHDWVAGKRFILDGSRQIGGDCGGWADPCVMFPR